MKKIALYSAIIALLVCLTSDVFAAPITTWERRVWLTPGCSTTPGNTCVYPVTWDPDVRNTYVIPGDVDIDYSTAVYMGNNTYMASPINNEPEEGEIVGYITYTTSGN